MFRLIYTRPKPALVELRYVMVGNRTLCTCVDAAVSHCVLVLSHLIPPSEMLSRRDMNCLSQYLYIPVS